ncbi:hypothetical protein QBC37DRAFT_484849 [Rhypophila decipiens]|uniref:Uncharacterized protein n=1 Tax=Rhypophila decipiens TaxID=261697 RepID=A0AAN7B5K4_9PEZI|nr:hypothetical protein QBC37DRAFT_484849 [Rhypophila decipiens]
MSGCHLTHPWLDYEIWAPAERPRGFDVPASCNSCIWEGAMIGGAFCWPMTQLDGRGRSIWAETEAVAADQLGCKPGDDSTWTFALFSIYLPDVSKGSRLNTAMHVCRIPASPRYLSRRWQREASSRSMSGTGRCISCIISLLRSNDNKIGLQSGFPLPGSYAARDASSAAPIAEGAGANFGESIPSCSSVAKWKSFKYCCPTQIWRPAQQQERQFRFQIAYAKSDTTMVSSRSAREMSRKSIKTDDRRT